MARLQHRVVGQGECPVEVHEHEFLRKLSVSVNHTQEVTDLICVAGCPVLMRPCSSRSSNAIDLAQ
jgi:hypothetical protein